MLSHWPHYSLPSENLIRIRTLFFLFASANLQHRKSKKRYSSMCSVKISLVFDESALLSLLGTTGCRQAADYQRNYAVHVLAGWWLLIGC